MKKGAKEDTQKALDFFTMAIRETNNFGIDEYNSIQELKYIDRKNCKDMFGRELPDGKFVRPVWSDNPERNDGYYDIPVEGCNTFGVLYSVMQWLNSRA